MERFAHYPVREIRLSSRVVDPETIAQSFAEVKAAARRAVHQGAARMPIPAPIDSHSLPEVLAPVPGMPELPAALVRALEAE